MTPHEAADVGVFAITGPGEYLARNGMRMRVLEYHQGTGCWLGRHSLVDCIAGFAWRRDGTHDLPGTPGLFDLVAHASLTPHGEGD